MVYIALVEDHFRYSHCRFFCEIIFFRSYSSCVLKAKIWTRGTKEFQEDQASREQIISFQTK